ncbi:hypothetical protein [Colwellia sp. Arc7-D]|jgi:hypothetical protein|uniref:hypothetical protein n=1 Tax=Colwellia sp. Arc7-D TaxID=2161872 RepID=UPI000D345824|nr:hypothetical protein [Colwellia sp. Arc7-D]AWB56633.1 hypothetical protein DBO93_03015 [Colwellia sp. Arc7-D]
MALKVDLKQFLDDEGNEIALTDQAKTVFYFITNIVLCVTKHIEQPTVEVDLKCSTRAKNLDCEGSIKASCLAPNMINWHCDCCEASGSISNWQYSKWDKQLRTLH